MKELVEKFSIVFTQESSIMKLYVNLWERVAINSLMVLVIFNGNFEQIN